MPDRTTSKTYHQLEKVVYQIGVLGEVAVWESKLAKGFWLIISTLLFIGCSNEIILLVTKYFNNPKATQVTVVNSVPPFPFVSVCSYSRIDQRKIEKYNFSDEFVSFLLSSFYGNYIAFDGERFNQSYLNVLNLQHQNFVRDHLNGTWSTSDFFLENAINCSDMILFCQFEGIDFDCLSYAERYLGSTGVCCEMQAPSLMQRMPGSPGGLTLAVHVLDTVYPTTAYYSNPDTGYRVHFTPRQEETVVQVQGGDGMDEADSSLTEGGVVPVNIMPGSHAMISLHATKYKFLQKDDSCKDGVTLKYTKEYSYKACIQECIVNLTLSRCGCVQMGILFVDRSLLCDPFTSASCVQPLYQLRNATTNLTLADELLSMGCHCPYPCTYWDYPIHIGHSGVPNRGYAKKLDKLFPETDHVAFSLIDIYFDFMVHHQFIETVTQTYTEFLAFFGGQMSLWLGIRIVTVVQLFLYGSHYIFCLFKTMVFQQTGTELRGKKNSSTQTNFNANVYSDMNYSGQNIDLGFYKNIYENDYKKSQMKLH